MYRKLEKNNRRKEVAEFIAGARKRPTSHEWAFSFLGSIGLFASRAEHLRQLVRGNIRNVFFLCYLHCLWFS